MSGKFGNNEAMIKFNKYFKIEKIKYNKLFKMNLIKLNITYKDKFKSISKLKDIKFELKKRYINNLENKIINIFLHIEHHFLIFFI